MAKVLDLNSIQVPVLELIFTDEARTTIHVCAPTEALVNEMESWANNDLKTLATGDRASVEIAYDLAARLLSCNKETRNITGAELRDKYNVDLWTLIPLLNAYLEFIAEIKNEKN